MPFTIALRIFLGHFELPGESQQIDRILMAFSSIFAQSTREETYSVSQLTILSFATVLLNTTLYSPHLQKFFTKRTCFSFTKDVNAACAEEKVASFSNEMLKEVYDSIVLCPLQLFTVPDDDDDDDDDDEEDDGEKDYVLQGLFNTRPLGVQVETACDGKSVAIVAIQKTACIAWIKDDVDTQALTGYILLSIGNISTLRLPYEVQVWLLKSTPLPFPFRIAQPRWYFRQHPM